MPKKKNKIIKIVWLVVGVGIVFGLHLSIYKSTAASVVFNEGISFGIKDPFLKMLLPVLAAGISLWWVKLEEFEASMLLVLIGAWINMINRLISEGMVWDYWLIPGSNIYNNIADCLIFVGVVWTVLKMIKSYNKNHV